MADMRIFALVEALRNHPRLGRDGTEPGIRELIICGMPYVVPYRVHGRRVIISIIWREPRLGCFCGLVRPDEEALWFQKIAKFAELLVQEYERNYRFHHK